MTNKGQGKRWTLLAGVLGAAILAERMNLRQKLGTYLVSSTGREAAVVRRSKSLGIVLAVLSLYLINHSRKTEEIDSEEKEWVARELAKRKDRLQGVLKFAGDSLNDQEEVDVDVVLEATDEVAQFHKLDPLVENGLLVAAKGVKSNILHIFNNRDSTMTVEDSTQVAASLLAQLNLSDQVLDQAEKSFVAKEPLLKVMEKAVNRANGFVTKRKTSQIVKTLSLLERAESQLFYLVVSSALSVLYGSIFALKTHYMGEVMTQAYEKIQYGQSKTSSISRTIQILFQLEILGVLSGFVSNKTKSMGRREFIVKLKTDLFRSLLSQDIAYFEQHDMFHARQIIGNADYVCQSLFDLPIDTIENLSSMVASVVMLFSKNRQLTMLLSILLPLRLLTTEMLTKMQDRMEASMISAHVSNFRDIWTILVNPIGMRTLRYFGREPIETAIFSQGLKAQDRAQEAGELVYNIFDVFRTLVEKSVEVASLWYGGNLASQGALDVSDVSSFTATADHAFERGRFVYYMMTNLFSNNGILNDAENMYDLLHSKPGIGIDEPAIGDMPRNENMEWSISFENVTFAYPTRAQVKALEDVTFEIKEGERVGVLGESGCGKSTLVSLILRLYDPQIGTVRISGKELKEFNPLWLRRRVAVVSQTIYLPFRTVKENLMYGLFDDENDDRSKEPNLLTDNEDHDEEMRAALRLAGCEELFFDKKRFKLQWHTDIGRDGSSLSGGERQRLCIARAILTKPRILILDEATSALDEENQYIIQEAIQKLYEKSGKRLTIITIAHRLSNFRHADKLIVLDKGKVVEQGTTQELAQLEHGIFANFVDRSTIDFANKKS